MKAHILIPVVSLAMLLRIAHAQSSEIHPSMADFVTALNEATAQIGTGHVEELLSATRALAAASRETTGLQPYANDDKGGSFDRYLEDLRNLSDDLVVHVENGQTPGAVSALREIRNTCVRCHTIFRPNTESNFPNRGNIIHGQVAIEKMNGDDRTDRSNVVVFLDRAPEGHPHRPHIAISQADRVFTPRVTAIVKGTTVDFPNDDIIFHNVFSLSKTKAFDLDIYSPGKSRSITFAKPGWAKVYCNIHPGMIAHVIVLDNPYFAVSDINGHFVIPNVPDGKYSIRTWHEFASSMKKRVDVTGEVVEVVDFQIQEDKRLRAHKNKFGKQYKGKY